MTSPVSAPQSRRAVDYGYIPLVISGVQCQLASIPAAGHAWCSSAHKKAHALLKLHGGMAGRPACSRHLVVQHQGWHWRPQLVSAAVRGAASPVQPQQLLRQEQWQRLSIPPSSGVNYRRSQAQPGDDFQKLGFRMGRKLAKPLYRPAFFCGSTRASSNAVQFVEVVPPSFSFCCIIPCPNPPHTWSGWAGVMPQGW